MKLLHRSEHPQGTASQTNNKAKKRSPEKANHDGNDGTTLFFRCFRSSVVVQFLAHGF